MIDSVIEELSKSANRSDEYLSFKAGANVLINKCRHLAKHFCASQGGNTGRAFVIIKGNL